MADTSRVRKYWSISFELRSATIRLRGHRQVRQCIARRAQLLHCLRAPATTRFASVYLSQPTTELKDRKICANLISPGVLETSIIDGQFAMKDEANGAREWFKSIIPIGRLVRPEEIASAALFLASDESSDVLGNDLLVDGRATAV